MLIKDNLKKNLKNSVLKDILSKNLELIVKQHQIQWMIN